jgi:hypothetical protein
MPNSPRPSIAPESTVGAASGTTVTISCQASSRNSAKPCTGRQASLLSVMNMPNELGYSGRMSRYRCLTCKQVFTLRYYRAVKETVMNLREKLIRLAHAKPELRRHLQDLLKTASAPVLLEDAAQPMRIVYNMYKRLVTNGSSIPFETVQEELDLAGTTLIMQINKMIRMSAGSAQSQKSITLQLVTNMLWFLTKLAEVEAHKRGFYLDPAQDDGSRYDQEYDEYLGRN